MKNGNYDSVSNPSHYNEGRNIQPIEVVEDWNLGFRLGNTVKYISRAGRKGGHFEMTEDLKKALWFLNREMTHGKGFWGKCENPKFDACDVAADWKLSPFLAEILVLIFEASTTLKPFRRRDKLLQRAKEILERLTQSEDSENG